MSKRISKNITLSITKELRTEMDKYPEVNWSSLARISFQNYIANKNKIPDEEWNKNISIIKAKNEGYPEVEAIVNCLKMLKEKQK